MTALPWTPSHLDRLPRCGWVASPTPVTVLPKLAGELGLDWLGIKRDDCCEGLHGGTKTRKLDFLLASPRLSQAPAWTSVGAIGSGHLVALRVAAEKLGRELEAYCFWEPLCDEVLSNLACTASGPTRLHFFESRWALIARCPGLLLAAGSKGSPSIPPGGSTPLGTLGTVRAGLELAMQIRRGELPRPDRIVVPWGTGGTAVGIAVGLSLGGQPIAVQAVATVERWLATRLQAGLLRRATLRLLTRSVGLLPDNLVFSKVEMVHGQVGPGYGHTTPASRASCVRLADHGICSEPIYGGKALAALVDDARGGRGGKVLYWLTSHRGALPVADTWKQTLPSALAAALDAPLKPSRITRRRLIASAAFVSVAATGGTLRLTGYAEQLPDWKGKVLARWESLVIVAVAEAVVPDVPGPLPSDGPTARELAEAVDAYLTALPASMRLEVHGMMAALEHGTGLDLQLCRLTRLQPMQRRSFLKRLSAAGGLLGQAARGARDLCYLGWYHHPRTWSALGYEGPQVAARRLSDPIPAGPYDRLVAPPRALPRGSRR